MIRTEMSDAPTHHGTFPAGIEAKQQRGADQSHPSFVTAATALCILGGAWGHLIWRDKQSFVAWWEGDLEALDMQNLFDGHGHEQAMLIT